MAGINIKEPSGITETSNEEIRRLYDYARFLAPTGYTILILGETGSGKGKLAERIHKDSKRSGEFVPVNCGALTQTLIESELFGHKKGAFTDAYRDKKGAFERADKGTLFLDEIGDLPLDSQVKLLRAIQYKKFQPLGSEREVSSDVRIICATNKDLRAAVDKEKFREDLFYRISVFTIKMPSLRERGKDDIKDIALKTLADIESNNKDTNLRHLEISEDAWQDLFNYQWPGNIRELRTVITRAFFLANFKNKESIDSEIIKEIFNSERQQYTHQDVTITNSGVNLKKLLEGLEKEFIEKALFVSGHNQSKAAKYLGMTQQNLSHKIKKYKL